MSQEQKLDVYQIVTDRIIAQLQMGTVPWQKPWTEAGMPRNLISGNAYRGINTWMLASMGFEKNLFLTWNQIKDLKASVKKNEKSQLVVFWKTIQKETDADESETKAKKKPLLRYYTVFNVAQCNDIPARLIPPEIEKPQEPIKHCEAIMQKMPNPPKLQHKMQEAWYNPGTDVLNMPRRKSFASPEAYYGTLFHELIHSTGHTSRLDRKELGNGFGTEPYSREELTAEIGACFLKSHAGIGNETFENSISYIDAWLGKLKNDKRLIIMASSHAQKAVDYILNYKHDEGISEEKQTAPEMVEELIET